MDTEELKKEINDMINQPVVGSGYQLRNILFEIIDRIEAIEKRIGENG